MQLLEFPPPKRNPAEPKRPGASEKKLHPLNTETQALMQALAFNEALAQAEERQLRMAVMRKYLGQEEARR